MMDAMKKICILFFPVLFLLSCGTGSYTVSSGIEDSSYIVFTALDRQAVTVFVDGISYDVETVKDKPYRKDRKIKHTALNTIRISPGTHIVKVVSGGNEIYSKKLFLSTDERKIVNL